MLSSIHSPKEERREEGRKEGMEGGREEGREGQKPDSESKAKVYIIL